MCEPLFEYTPKQLVDHTLNKLKLIQTTDDYEQLLTTLRTSHPTRPIILSYLNAHAFNLMQKDPAFCYNLLCSDILLRDGIGIAILLKLYHRAPGINMNGTDFNPRIIHQYAGKTIVLCGTSNERLAKAQHTLEQQGCKIALTIDGFQSKETYLEKIQALAPDLIVLGMGMPKQESVAIYLQQHLSCPCLILNTGAAIDYISGDVPRAPRWVRVLRSEWLYRLVVEPKRLWKRYILGNPQFLATLFFTKLFRGN